MGWLIFSDRTPSQDGTASGQSTGSRKTGNSFDATGAVAASDYALAAVSGALAAERAGDLPATTKFYDDIRKKEATLPGLNYQLAVLAVGRGIWSMPIFSSRIPCATVNRPPLAITSALPGLAPRETTPPPRVRLRQPPARSLFSPPIFLLGRMPAARRAPDGRHQPV